MTLRVKGEIRRGASLYANCPEAEKRLEKLRDFLESLEKERGLPRTVSGEIKGPFESRMEYRCTVKFVEVKDFSRRRGFHPRSRSRG